jgi:hypothetical protein
MSPATTMMQLQSRHEQQQDQPKNDPRSYPQRKRLSCHHTTARCRYHARKHLLQGSTKNKLPNTLLNLDPKVTLNRVVQRARDMCTRKYGYSADPMLSAGNNLHNIHQAHLHNCIYLDRLPTDPMANNLCQDPSTVPPATLHVLGLGLGYGLSLSRTDETHQFREILQSHPHPVHVS